MGICVLHLGTLIISDISDFGLAAAKEETFSLDLIGGSSIFVLAGKSDSVDFGLGGDTFSIFHHSF